VGKLGERAGEDRETRRKILPDFEAGRIARRDKCAGIGAFRNLSDSKVERRYKEANPSLRLQGVEKQGTVKESQKRRTPGAGKSPWRELQKP